MKELLKKYYKMNDEEKAELEDLFLLHQLQKILEGNQSIDLDFSEEEAIFNATRNCLEYVNISCREVVTRMLQILEEPNTTAFDIEKLGVEELVELISEDNKESKDIKEKTDIVTAFVYGKFYCVLIKNNEKYILVYEKDDGTQYVDKGTIEDMVKYIIKNRLIDKGDSIV